jgi:hypothetical protein
MANSTVGKTAAPATPITLMSVMAPALGWLIPGAGHMAQKRWVRGGLLLVSILGMAVLGLLMQGRMYQPIGSDLLEVLGFVGDLGTGGLYLLAQMMGWGQAAPFTATADYGKIFIIAAGLLNFIAAADAYHIAIGKKS